MRMTPSKSCLGSPPRSFSNKLLVDIFELHARKLRFELAQIFHALHQLLRLLELHRRLAAKQTSFAAQPIFELADLIELHDQLLKFFFRVWIFEPVGGKLLDRFAGFARQVVEELFLVLNIVPRLIHLLEASAAPARPPSRAAPGLRPSPTAADTRRRACASRARLAIANPQGLWSASPPA